jgi:hypothetical protein
MYITLLFERDKGEVFTKGGLNMKYCLICGTACNDGINFDGYWFDDMECVQIYCAFMGIEYQPQPDSIAA